MISELGFLLLTIVFLVSSLDSFELLMNKKYPKNFSFDQDKLSKLIFLLTLSSFICLSFSFIIQFSHLV